ncbi:MAG: tetratricopeptide repeat protein [Balneolaceae bacterium]|nr:tetratricopeptide repeat protein [Balneolaceae bacterium]MDR9446783.1 tetratricopeptide repeat protein [Balneolaceae bacterium]
MKSFSLLSPLAVAILLVGCTTVSPLVKETQDNIGTGNYEAALESAELAIEENPTNGLGQYYKAVALGSIGQETDQVAARRGYYADALSTMEEAKSLFDALEDRPDEADNTDNVLRSIWADEHNSAVEILTVDSIAASYEDPNQVAVDHLLNATKLAPDSVISHSVLSSAYYRTGDIASATNAYETVMDLIPTPEADDYNYMINLFLASQRFEDARDLATEAQSTFPDDERFIQYLADSYLQTGETDKAIEIVEDLIASDPTNPQYRLVLGTQVYQTVTELTDQISEMYVELYDQSQALSGLSGDAKTEAEAALAELQEEADALEAEIEGYTDLAIEQVTRATELDPTSSNTFNILGVIYQNKSALYFEKRNNTADYDLADEYDAQAREVLDLARVAYEKATELDGDNPEYWQSLFQIYTTLNMPEKAQEAMEKAGI